MRRRRRRKKKRRRKRRGRGGGWRGKVIVLLYPLSPSILDHQNFLHLLLRCQLRLHPMVRVLQQERMLLLPLMITAVLLVLTALAVCYQPLHHGSYASFVCTHMLHVLQSSVSVMLVFLLLYNLSSVVYVHVMYVWASANTRMRL